MEANQLVGGVKVKMNGGLERNVYKAYDVATHNFVGSYTINEWRDIMLKETSNNGMKKIHNKIKHKPRTSLIGYLAREFDLKFVKEEKPAEKIDLDDKLIKKLTKKDFYRLSICWDCQNSLMNCPWSIGFKPVEGWTAKQMSQNTAEPTFLVQSCPLFKQDFFQLNTVMVDDLMKKIYANKPSISYNDYKKYFNNFGWDFKVIDDESFDESLKIRYYIRRIEQ